MSRTMLVNRTRPHTASLDFNMNNEIKITIIVNRTRPHTASLCQHTFDIFLNFLIFQKGRFNLLIDSLMGSYNIENDELSKLKDTQLHFQVTTCLQHD